MLSLRKPQQNRQIQNRGEFNEGGVYLHNKTTPEAYQFIIK